MNNIGTPSNPLFVRISTAYEEHPIRMMVFSILPVAIIILMQNPALRQRLMMQGCHYAKETCHAGSDALIQSANSVSKLGDIFGTWYNKVRM